MLRLVVLFCLLVSEAILVDAKTEISPECPDGSRFRSRSYAFFPALDGSQRDAGGNPLMTLQDFLENKTSYVTLALDTGVAIPRGTPICIPEFNRKYRRDIVFQYRDTADEMEGKMYSQCAVCVRDKIAAHEVIVNQYVTLVVPRVILVNDTKR